MCSQASVNRIFISLRKPFCPKFRRALLTMSHPSCRARVKNRCLSTSSRCLAKEPEESYLRYLYVNTSLNLWEECPHGVNFDVGYVDSHSVAEANDKMPVIVGLPGILETHESLSDLLLPFGKLGYRVVIPNFPGNKITKGLTQPDEDIYQYSIEERSGFVKDFLKELEVNRVDMLVTSHCSSYPGLHLTLREPDKFRSLVMINPAGVRPSRLMEPTKNHKYFTKLWDSPVLRAFLKGAIILVRPFTSFRGWNLRHVITFSRSVAGTSFDEVEELVKHARTISKRPSFVIYSDSDKLIETEISEELVERLGIPKSSIQVIREDDKSTSDSNQSVSSVKRSAIDVSTVQGVKFEGVNGDILTVKASVIKKILWDYVKTVTPGS